MKRKTKRRIRYLSYMAPRILWLYRICKMYADNYRGINNSDMIINGEINLLNNVLPFCSGAILDVGANKGQWTKAVLSLMPNAHIHCFEPVQSLYKKLASNSFTDNITINPFGLGEKAEYLKIHIYGKDSELNSIYQSVSRKPIQTQKVKIVTAEEYCEQKDLQEIFFMKVDVEGHDLAVLKGAMSLFQNGCIQIAQFEYSANWIVARNYLKDFFELAETIPYNVYRIMPFGLMRIDKYLYKLDNFQHANYVLIHQAFQIPKKLKVIYR